MSRKDRNDILESLLRAWQKLLSGPVIFRFLILLFISSGLALLVGIPLGFNFLQGIAASDCSDWQCQAWKILKILGVSLTITLGLLALWGLIFYLFLSTFFANFLIRFTSHNYPMLKAKAQSLKFILYQTKIFAVYIVVLMASLPFWLIPGVSAVVLLAGTTFLNRFLFVNEVLFEYASKEEQKLILAKNNKVFWMISFISSLGLLVPFLNLLVPMWTALAHYDFTFKKIVEHRSQ